MEIKYTEIVWADEAGIGVRFESSPGGKVRVTIIEYDSGHVYESATISEWRWKRVVEKMASDKTLQGNL